MQFSDTSGHRTVNGGRKKLLNLMTNNKVVGVINIVNYGYQYTEELAEDWNRVFKVGAKEVKQSFLKENRKREIQRTEELLERISPDLKKIKWIITVINKADVWYDDKEEVIKYYTEGDYGEIIKKLSHKVDIYTAPFCSVIAPFANRPMQLVYSERDKKIMFDTFCEHLNSII